MKGEGKTEERRTDSPGWEYMLGRTDSLHCGRTNRYGGEDGFARLRPENNRGREDGFVAFSFPKRMKIEERLGRALAGSAHPRCVCLFESIYNDKKSNTGRCWTFVVRENITDYFTL